MTKTKDKEKARKAAKKEGREVLWKDREGYWHAAINWANTPFWATETEDV